MSTHSPSSAGSTRAARVRPEGAMDPKRRGRLVLGAVFLAVFIAFTIEAWRMPQGQLGNPGAGVLPLWVGLIGIVSSIIALVEAGLDRSETGELELPQGESLRKSLVFLVTLVAYVVMLPLLGQYVAATVYVVLFLRFGGRLSWIRSILVSLLIGGGLSWAFIDLLGLSMPGGLLFGA